MSEPNNRIEPSFFGSGYGQAPKKKHHDDWQEPNNAPPPPYSPVPNEPTSSRPTTNPSAPPLDAPNYGHYGSVPYPAQNATSDANMPTWPWISPPSAPEQPVFISPVARSPAEEPMKKSKNWCELSVQYIFYLLCICLVIRMIDLLTGVSYEGSCAHGIEWKDLPKEFNFEKGIKIHTVGGHLSNGQITIKTITPSTIIEDGIVTGTVRASALIFPPRLAENSDLSFTITHFLNGTTLQIYIPQDLTRNACIRFNVVIYVPQGTPYIDIEVENSRIIVADGSLIVPEIGLRTSNQPIDFHAAWGGQLLMMNTKNAHVELNQPILNSGNVIVTTTNAHIRARCTLKATESIYLATTNAGIEIDELVYSEKAVRLITSNAHIIVNNVTADKVEINSSNGRINVEHGNAISLFNAHTTNAEVNVNLDSGAHSEISIRSTNGELCANLPGDYEGFFNFDISRNNKLTFIDELGWSRIDSMSKGHLSGIRLAPGQTNQLSSRVQVMTSNANAYIHFIEAK